MKKFFPFCVAMGLLGIGAMALVDAKKSAATYGLPTTDDAALGFVRGCGARDIVLGLILLAQLDRAKPVLLFTSLIAVADFSIVATSAKKEDGPSSSLAIHAIGAIGLLFTGLMQKQ